MTNREYEEKIKVLEGIINVKELERQQWAAMCIKKQAKIESLTKALEKIQEANGIVLNEAKKEL